MFMPTSVILFPILVTKLLANEIVSSFMRKSKCNPTKKSIEIAIPSYCLLYVKILSFEDKEKLTAFLPQNDDRLLWILEPEVLLVDLAAAPPSIPETGRLCPGLTDDKISPTDWKCSLTGRTIGISASWDELSISLVC